MNHVIFSNFSNQLDSIWAKTGAVTFYESPFEMNYCSFYNNKSEDALNVIRSNFIINNSIFSNNSFDAFDGDFCEGTLENTDFYFSGNDAIDLSGSNINLNSVNISEAMDKGISAGESSFVNALKINISNSKLGLVSKDMSKIVVNGVSIDSTEMAVVLFQKKPEFGSAEIIADNIVLQFCQDEYLVESGSKLTINGNLIEPNTFDLKKLLYDN